MDPFLRPAFSYSNKVRRVLWWLFYCILFRWSPKPFFLWRRFLLRCFGATVGSGCAIYPSARIWAPWNLVCSDMVAIASGVEIYNPSKVYIGSHAILSQNSYLCGATHDYHDANFPLISDEIIIGDYAWICARACVMSGVTVSDGAVLGLGSVATKNLGSWSVYAGLPAVFVKLRKRIDGGK